MRQQLNLCASCSLLILSLRLSRPCSVKQEIFRVPTVLIMIGIDYFKFCLTLEKYVKLYIYFYYIFIDVKYKFVILKYTVDCTKEMMFNFQYSLIVKHNVKSFTCDSNEQYHLCVHRIANFVSHIAKAQEPISNIITFWYI